MQRFIVVSGLPASGKSSIGRVVADGLGLSLFDKDVFLEALFAQTEPRDAHERSQLSRRADEAFQRGAMASSGAVLASWWKHRESPLDSGTPTAWLESLPGPIVELHCLCDPGVAAERFVARRRHAGHHDGRWSLAELQANFEQQAVLGPLGIGRLVTVRTDSEVDHRAVLAQVTVALESAQR